MSGYIMRSFLQKVPKSELHVHLRGAMPVDTFARLIHKYADIGIWEQESAAKKSLYYRKFSNLKSVINGKTRTYEDLSSFFQYKGFEHFIATFSLTGYYFREIDDFRLLIQGVIDYLIGQCVIYAEITISIHEYIRQGIPIEAIRDCLDEAAEDHRIRVQWIIDFVRDYGSEHALLLLHKIKALNFKSVVGITLGGREYSRPAREFTRVYQTAREYGMHLSIHAGEVCGPESVWEALRFLDVDRIGHGVRAVEDPALVEYLAEHNIPLEICPTSNIRTGIIQSYQKHPIKKLLEAGVLVTINTDDPTFFETTLMNEYIICTDQMGLSPEQLYEVMQNGFTCAFLPPDDKRKYLNYLEQKWNQSVLDFDSIVRKDGE